MTEVKCFEDFEHVVPDVEVSKLLVESSKIDVAGVHVLHDQCWRFGHRVTHYVDQIDNVDAVLQGLENLDFTTDFGLLD